MCCTTTIGGIGGPSAPNSWASAGGPPVEMPMRDARGRQFGAQAAGSALAGAGGAGQAARRVFRSRRISRMRRTSVPAAARIFRDSSSLERRRRSAPAGLGHVVHGAAVQGLQRDRRPRAGSAS